jgi:hypothetical protein
LSCVNVILALFFYNLKGKGGTLSGDGWVLLVLGQHIKHKVMLVTRLIRCNCNMSSCHGSIIIPLVVIDKLMWCNVVE